MNKIISSKKGSALVVTLAVVAVLLAASLHLGKAAGDSALQAARAKDMFKAEQYALSGIEIARLILMQDGSSSDIDSVQEDWASPDKLLEIIDQSGPGRENLEIKITDELSKIQLNALIKEFPGSESNFDQIRIWEKFLQSLSAEDNNQEETAVIINCIIDWIDSLDDDAVTGISGAESDYYLGLEPSYSCANGPFNRIEELFNVKGILKDIFNEYREASENQDSIQLEIEDVFTVYGVDAEFESETKFRYKGKININTAPVNLISALLPLGMEDYALDLTDHRLQKSQDGEVFLNSLEKGWYKNVIDLSKEEQEGFERLICYSSDIFKVESTGSENSSKVKMNAWIKREKNRENGEIYCRIIQIERKS